MLVMLSAATVKAVVIQWRPLALICSVANREAGTAQHGHFLSCQLFEPNNEITALFLLYLRLHFLHVV